MKTKILYILTIFFITSFSTQKEAKNYKTSKKNKAIGKVTYIYKSKYRKYLIERESFLLFNDNNSIFIHSRGKEPMVEVMGDKGQDGYVQDKIGNLILKDFENKTIKIRQLVMFQPYLTEEPLPEFKWDITSQEKKIGKFKCRLAKTSFRGRNYDAWFTIEIPISDGPWKFNGLPGLILEVVDSKKEYHFIYKSIEMPPVKDEEIVFVNNGINLPFEKFIKAEDIEFEKMKKRSQASSTAEGFKMTKTPTNPIELNFE